MTARLRLLSIVVVLGLIGMLMSCDNPSVRNKARARERELLRETAKLTGNSVSQVLREFGQPIEVTAEPVQGPARKELVTFWYREEIGSGFFEKKHEIIVRVVFDGEMQVSGASASLTIE